MSTNESDTGRSDAAALSYLRACLDGRANRLRRGRRRRETLGYAQDVSDAEGDAAQASSSDGWEAGFKRVAERMLLHKAMRRLTEREKALIFDLFWMQKTVSDVCAERGISKNSVLKMKRNALQKMERFLENLR